MKQYIDTSQDTGVKMVEAGGGNLPVNTSANQNVAIWQGDDIWFERLSIALTWSNITGDPGAFDMIITGRGVAAKAYALSEEMHFPALCDFSSRAYGNGVFPVPMINQPCGDNDIIAVQIYNKRGTFNGSNFVNLNFLLVGLVRPFIVEENS